MSQSIGVSSNIAFQTSAEQRLTEYCKQRFGRPLLFTKLMGDASTRQYFRVNDDSASYIASMLAFDQGRLFWELQFFFKHFTAVSGKQLTQSEETDVIADLTAIARELASRPRLLTHRDYHSRNLMVGSTGELFVIDHQD